ncbi:MAG: diphosphate--fructose-6-phosphate 1-phosphotransferase [bacterium]
MLKGNAIIGQSGGPTSVRNCSLAGVISEAAKCRSITGIYGMRFGIEGFLKEDIIDLKKEGKNIIKQLQMTPSSALGSCRLKLKDKHLPPIKRILEKYNIRHFYLIGGNDTMDTIKKVEEYCWDNGYEIQGIGIPKTVDNDLYGTDHTPGFPSAARYVALSVMQGGILARDMQKVDQFTIYQAVGRDSGWLAASSALAKQKESDPPHIILIPEVPFNRNKFLAEFKRCYTKYGWVSIVLGEGVSYADGTPISASRTKDKFSNIEFGAMGGTSAAMMLHKIISDKFNVRGEFQVVESLQMCASDRVSKIDATEAFRCGCEAVRLSIKSKSGLMVSMGRAKGKAYKAFYGTEPLKNVAIKAKPMPKKFISKSGFFVNQSFIDYLKPLVGELPSYAFLKAVKVRV